MPVKKGPQGRHLLPNLHQGKTCWKNHTHAYCTSVYSSLYFSFPIPICFRPFLSVPMPPAPSGPRACNLPTYSRPSPFHPPTPAPLLSTHLPPPSHLLLPPLLFPACVPVALARLVAFPRVALRARPPVRGLVLLQQRHQLLGVRLGRGRWGWGRQHQVGVPACMVEGEG